MKPGRVQLHGPRMSSVRLQLRHDCRARDRIQAIELERRVESATGHRGTEVAAGDRVRKRGHQSSTGLHLYRCELDVISLARRDREVSLEEAEPKQRLGAKRVPTWRSLNSEIGAVRQPADLFSVDLDGRCPWPIDRLFAHKINVRTARRSVGVERPEDA